jgi:predicted RNA-binding Zn-ribbon protein involved in translation (DUF1610 family)
MVQRSCLFAGCRAESAQFRYVNDGFEVMCPDCGTYTISRTFSATEPFRQDLRAIQGLRIYVRLENEAGRVPDLRETDWQKLASPHKPSPFSALFQS